MKHAFYVVVTAYDKRTRAVVELQIPTSGPVSTFALAQRICATEHAHCVAGDERCGGSAFEHRYEVIERPLEAKAYSDDVYTEAWFEQRMLEP